MLWAMKGDSYSPRLQPEGNEISKINFYYTEIFLLPAIENKLLQHQNSNTKAGIRSTMAKLRTGHRNEKVSIKRTQMIKVNSMDEILALAGLFSVKRSGWRDDLFVLSETEAIKRGCYLN